MEKCVCLYFRKSMALKTLMSAPNSVLGQITPSNLRFSNSEKGQPGYSIFKNLSTANLFGNGDSFCSFSKVAEKKNFFFPKRNPNVSFLPTPSFPQAIPGVATRWRKETTMVLDQGACRSVCSPGSGKLANHLLQASD